MRYDESCGRILVEVTEMVSAARRGIGAAGYSSDEEPYSRAAEGGEKCALSLDFDVENLHFTLHGSPLYAKDGEIAVCAEVEYIREARRRDVSALWRGVAFIFAYIFALREGLDRVNTKIIYTALDSEEQSTSEESVTMDKLSAFFEKCRDAMLSAARAEIDRVTVRLPSMKNLKFPYGKARAGQDEFIRAAYRTMAKGGELFATAPTGTGKTVSSLFPAVRALGDGRCEKVFYFTPKTTTAEAARDCLARFSEGGAVIRAIQLIAKERICRRGSVCRESKRLCPTSKENKLNEAVFALYDEGITTVMPADVRRVAEEYTVCPYELSLTYSELCDIVICDFNYLFDPQVYIRRYFTRGGSYAFLIDEAHNLCERAREMYSAAITETEIRAAEMLSDTSSLREVATRAADAFHHILTDMLKDEMREGQDGTRIGAYHSKNVPGEFFELFELLAEAADGELYESYRAKDEDAAARTQFLRDYSFRVKKFLSALSRFDDKFEFFAHLEGEKLSAKVFCLDTGGVIRSRLDLGKSAVFFSGTLSPISYYKSILGGDNSSSTLALDSPFTPEQLSVSVMHNITTRVSEREKSLPAVCRVIAATLSAKRGNYMIFSPSFAYSEMLYNIFRKKYPKIRAIIQRPGASDAEKEQFLAEFSKEDNSYLAAFCVTGGIYSEGIDLSGDKLIGAVIVGIGMPALSFEREAIAAYYDEKLEMGVQYAYLYPGMNRVLQAAGRVIRTEDDRGVIVLIDDRFDDPLYKKIAPSLWRGMQFLEDAQELRARLDEFWSEQDE